MLKISLLNLRWDNVLNATGYEIRVNNKVVSTTGPNARTTKVAVLDNALIEVIDLPKRSVIQAVDFSQKVV